MMFSSWGHNEYFSFFLILNNGVWCEPCVEIDTCVPIETHHGQHTTNKNEYFLCSSLSNFLWGSNSPKNIILLQIKSKQNIMQLESTFLEIYKSQHAKWKAMTMV